MLSIHVAQLLQDLPGATRVVDFSERLADPSDELHLLAPIQGRAKLTLTQRGVLAQVRYRTRAQLECARCLDPVEVPVDSTFAEEFLAHVNMRTGVPTREMETRNEEDRDASHIGEDHTIRLDDLVRQDLLTQLPFQPLCDTACPGLCPRCGERLDARHAPHPESPDDAAPQAARAADNGEVHQPFAVLAELLRRQEERGSPDPDA